MCRSATRFELPLGTRQAAADCREIAGQSWRKRWMLSRDGDVRQISPTSCLCVTIWSRLEVEHISGRGHSTQRLDSAGGCTRATIG